MTAVSSTPRGERPGTHTEIVSREHVVPDTAWDDGHPIENGQPNRAQRRAIARARRSK